MLGILLTAVVAFLFYLLLTLGSGTVGPWSIEELTTGVVSSLIAGRRKEGGRSSLRMLNPLRLLLTSMRKAATCSCIGATSPTPNRLSLARIPFDPSVPELYGRL